MSVTDKQYFVLAVAIYGLCTLYSVFLWRRGFQRDDRINYILLLLGFAFHVISMFKRGISFQRCPVTNLYEATVFISWALATSYLVLGVFRRFRFLGAFASPLLLMLGVFALMPNLDVQGPTHQFTNGVPSLHAALTLLAYGAFGLAAVASAMFLTQEHDLKFNRMRAILSVLPSMQRLRGVVTRLLIAGFVLLTVGLVAGEIYLIRSGVAMHKPDAKVIWSIGVWLAYLGLLVLRWRVDHGGRRVAWGAIGVFVFVLLTFWGTNLLSPLHQQ